MPASDTNEEVVSLNIINNTNTATMQQDTNEQVPRSWRSETAEMNENILQFIKQTNIQPNVDL